MELLHISDWHLGQKLNQSGRVFVHAQFLAWLLDTLEAEKVRVASLLIDEGFDSLDADSMGTAMDALDNLQSKGREAGVMSYIHEVTEHIGTRVRVQCQSGGLSRIVVC